MDSSKILVMDAGEFVEFDSPMTLINRKDSVFNQMIQATGREMAQTLRKIAKEIELLRAAGSSRLELSEKIQESITVIKEDDKDSDYEDELDIDQANLDQILNDEEIISSGNKNEFTHF